METERLMNLWQYWPPIIFTGSNARWIKKIASFRASAYKTASLNSFAGLIGLHKHIHIDMKCCVVLQREDEQAGVWPQQPSHSLPVVHSRERGGVNSRRPRSCWGSNHMRNTFAPFSEEQQMNEFLYLQCTRSYGAPRLESAHATSTRRRGRWQTAGRRRPPPLTSAPAPATWPSRRRRPARRRPCRRNNTPPVSSFFCFLPSCRVSSKRCLFSALSPPKQKDIRIVKVPQWSHTEIFLLKEPNRKCMCVHPLLSRFAAKQCCPSWCRFRNWVYTSMFQFSFLFHGLENNTTAQMQFVCNENLQLFFFFKILTVFCS